MKRLFRGLNLFLKLNILKTLLFNFKLLPFKEAVHLPILLFGKISISENTGKLRLNEVKFGTVRIGYHPHRLYGKDYCNSLTRISIRGVLNIGKRVTISNGCFIKVEEKGILSIGNYVYVGPNTKFYTQKGITIGDTCNFSWECQIFDTDFHYVIDGKGFVSRNDKNINIGNNVWIGNRVTINKGSVIPNYSIIASNSLVNKNLSKEHGSGVYAGIPVKLVAKDRVRLFDSDLENHINDYFKQYQDKNLLFLNDIINP